MVAGARDESTSRSSGANASDPLFKAKQLIKDPTLQYKQKTKGKSTHTQTQSQRLATHEEKEQRKTSSSSRSSSPQGDHGQNQQAYEGSNGGDGEDNVSVYDMLHGGQSEPAGSWDRNEERYQKNILNSITWHQVLGPHIPIVHKGRGSSMDTHHDPSYKYRQQSSGYGGPSHGYGQQQYGGQVHQMPMGQFGYGHPDPSNYGQGPPTPREAQGFFDFDIEQYYRQNQNDDDNKEGIQPARHSTWYFRKIGLRYGCYLVIDSTLDS